MLFVFKLKKDVESGRCLSACSKRKHLMEYCYLTNVSDAKLWEVGTQRRQIVYMKLKAFESWWKHGCINKHLHCV